MRVFGFLVACLALSRAGRSSSASLLTADDNTTPTNINFVEVIKKDLKHDNDDYKEMANKRSPTSTLVNGKDTGKEEVEHFRRGNRKYSEEDEYGAAPVRVSVQYNVTRDKSEADAQNSESKVAKLNGIMLPTAKPLPGGKETLRNNQVDIPKFVNEDKVDKFKQFMEKNKELLKQYISSKVGAQTHTEAPVLKKVVRPALLRGALQRKKLQRYGEDEEALAPEMLDMSPAKGGRVHRQRLKGRLCHRHVLLPEGPKYDSSGKWYLKEHPPAALRPYEVTHHPKLLLPRCCNCCKKSVLGCE